MYSEHVVHGVPLTRENFSQPPLEMGIVPFWFWNGDLDKGEMEWQLKQYYDRGVRSLFIHGRMGLSVGYLSEEWFDRVAFCVEKAKEIGMDAWVYDEMDWPSGTAEGQVIEADPELAQRYLELVPLRLEGPIFTFLEAHDDRYVPTGNSNPIAAYGVRGDEYDSVIRNPVDLNKNLAWEKTIAWEAPAGDWVLMYFLEKEAPFYIDTLNPASTEKFIELTHEKYRRTVGHEFGSTVPGFFTDEPAMYYYHVGMQNYVVPWSRQMFKIFRERRGYDLKPHLPALYADMGERTARIRYDFWRTLTEQYAETYYKRLRDWCDENGVIFTGHLLFEEHLRLAARCEGNFFKYLQHMHLIGVDHLYPKIGTREEPDQHVALKVGSSAAHHFGSTRLLCESMGGTYWDCTLDRMKWMNNWEYVLGVNLFNNHGYHYTIEGERKRDWPPSQFYHHTWWKYYDRFTEYNARLSHTLSGGRHVAKVLMLYPINSVWINYLPQKTTRIGQLIESDFQWLTDRLLRLHYDYDYVDEDVLADASIENGKMYIADEEFEILILPPVTHIKSSTYDKIKAFLEQGGSVIADTVVPIGLLEDGVEESVTPLDTFLGINGQEVLESVKQGNGIAFDVEHHEDQGRLYFFRGAGLAGQAIKPDRLTKKSEATSTGHDAEAALSRVLQRCAEPDVTISDDEIFYLHRRKDRFDIYFLVNTTQEDRGGVEVSFEQVGQPELWNPNTGVIEPIHVYRVEGGRLYVDLDFPPSEAHVVVMRDAEGAAHVVDTNLDISSVDEARAVGYSGDRLNEAHATIVSNGQRRVVRADAKGPLAALELPDTYDFDLETDNVLALGSYRMNPYDDSDAYAAPDFDDSDWLLVEIGAWEMQLPTERDEATYPVPVWYRAEFDLIDLPPNPRLVIDGFSGSSHRLFLNGVEIKDEGRRSWLDAEMREVDISEHLQEGRNVVAIRLVVTRRTDGMLDLLKILGSFSLTDDLNIARHRGRLGVGDWSVQGYPFFSGTIALRASLDVPDDYVGTGRLVLEADCGDDVLEVRVNESDPVVVPWHPYRIDVSQLVRAGRNDIELRVTNTLINILEGEPRPSGLFARPRIVHEHRYDLTTRD